ncbi:MAG: hypothetical protein WDK95_16035 [Syntrophorhabdaceae bacterium]
MNWHKEGVLTVEVGPENGLWLKRPGNPLFIPKRVVQSMYEAVFGKRAQPFTPGEAALLSALLDRLDSSSSVELERMASVIDAKLDGMGACDGVRRALVGTIELESAHPF